MCQGTIRLAGLGRKLERRLMKLIIERQRNDDQIVGEEKYQTFMYTESEATFKKNEEERLASGNKQRIDKKALAIECDLGTFPNEFYMVFDLKGRT